MASILPNGIRYYMKDTKTHYSEVTLLIPVGENHENSVNIECAHTSEHFACAFNGGFSKPYEFLQLRTKYGVHYEIHTYEDHTVFRVTSIPKEAIVEICKFLSGIFVLNKPPREIANREISIIHSELKNNQLTDLLYYKYIGWIRYQSGKPTVEPLNQTHGLSPEKVYQFHSQYYRPVNTFLCVRRPPVLGTQWDRELSSTMSRTESIMIPGRNYTNYNCDNCKVIEGIWLLPSRECWGSVGVFFRGSPERSEVLARSLISSVTRLTGAHVPGDMSLTDYLRTQKGVTYSTTGRMIRMKHNGNQGVLVVFVFSLQRHLTRQEITEIMEIVSNRAGRMPSRGDLSNMVARITRKQKSSDLSFLLKESRTPILDTINWSTIHQAHKKYSSDSDCIGGVFSSPV
jgi:hypothetical protein